MDSKIHVDYEKKPHKNINKTAYVICISQVVIQ